MHWTAWLVRYGLVVGGTMGAYIALVAMAFQTLASDHVNWLFWIVLAAGIGCLILAGLAAAYCLYRLQEPLATLHTHVQAYADSQPTSQPPVNLHDSVTVNRLLQQMVADLLSHARQSDESSGQLATVLRAMEEGVIAVDADLKVLLANDAAKLLLEFVTPDAVGRPLVVVTRLLTVHEAVRQAWKTNATVTTEFSLPGKPQKMIAVRASCLPGEPCPGILLVLHDMTELRRLETMRRDLVANASHELKTPLAAIKAYAETLRLGAINDQQHNLTFVKQIEDQAEQLHRLILDMLRIARLDAGSEPLDLRPVALADCVAACATQFRSLAAAKDLALHVAEIEPDLVVLADADGLKTVLSNLLDNAIKFTPAGGEVQVRAAGDADTVWLDVQDSGIGIPEQHLPRIFERFYRVDKARQRESGSVGLGLSIAKNLVQALGGHIDVESDAGRGSTFRVKLPRYSQFPQERLPPAISPAAGDRVSYSPAS